MGEDPNHCVLIRRHINAVFIKLGRNLQTSSLSIENNKKHVQHVVGHP